MSNNTILIVDDEIRIRRMLVDFLKSCGYITLEAKDGQDAVDVFYANNSKVDCIILDVMMPKLDGFEVLKEIREVSLVPIIMLTAKSEEYDELLGFKCGADDYITKPFSPTLLLARLEAVLKRCHKIKDGIISIGDIRIDESKKEVMLEDKIVPLTPKEFELLSYLVANKNTALSRQRVLNSVWNYDYLGDLRTVDTHIKQLRAKLMENGKCIKTVHGFGYKLEVIE
jgi:DNA-binding response OmpR family regulator